MLGNMRLRTGLLWLLALLIIICGLLTFYKGRTLHAATQTTLYVSPQGDDTYAGTIDQPFRTIEHARQVVRPLLSSMSGDIVVILRGGTYTLTNTQQFDANDSGQNGYNVIYQAYTGETPIISGGTSIGGWSQSNVSQNIWQANVGTTLQTRQLYVNGVRAQRATGDASILGSVQVTSTGYLVSNLAIQRWSRPTDLEFVYTGAGNHAASVWSESRCSVSSVAAQNGKTQITMEQGCFQHTTATNVCGFNGTLGIPTAIENNRSLLTQPGTWYLDHGAGTLYYIPRPGEVMNTVPVVAPVLETLIQGNGTATSALHDLQFKGLTFAYATWLQSNGYQGFVDTQANYITLSNNTCGMTPANVAFSHVQHLRMEGNTFLHLGAQGLAIENGSHNNVVIGNVFTDISGTALRIGNLATPRATSNNQDTGAIVSDNYIHDIAVEYHGGVAIFGGNTAHCIITHNEIANLPYTGIEWGLGLDIPSYSTDNSISFNKVHDVMNLLKDGGNIYVNGAEVLASPPSQPVSTIDHNWVYNDPQETASLYIDNASSGWHVTSNVVSNTSTRWVFLQDAVTAQYDLRATYNAIDGNYYPAGAPDNLSTAPPTNSNANNTAVANDQWPQAARDIMQQAGLEPIYQAITNGPVPENIAIGKLSFASTEFSADYPATSANDGSTPTGWSPAAGDPQPWWELDLGSPYLMSQLQFATRQDIDQPETRHNFELWVSNSAHMLPDHVVVWKQGSEVLPFQSVLTVNLSSTTAYRYIALVKPNSEYAYIAEMRVFAVAPSSN